MYHALKFSIGVINGLRLQNYAKRQNKWFEGGTGAEIRLRLWRLEMKFKLKWHWCISGKIWALQYDNGEEVALLYTEKDTVRWDELPVGWLLTDGCQVPNQTKVLVIKANTLHPV